MTAIGNIDDRHIASRNGVPHKVLRILQLVLAIIVLGCSAYVTHHIDASQSDFLIFVALWTLIVAGLLFFIHKNMPTPNHTIFSYFAVDLVTSIFWFAGFIAMVVWEQDVCFFEGNRVCSNAKAAYAFAIIEWLLFEVALAQDVYHFIVRNKGAAGVTNTHTAHPTVGVHDQTTDLPHTQNLDGGLKQDPGKTYA